MANLKISLRKKGASSFEGGDKLLPETDWAYILNKPATFVPDPHGHSIEEITGLQSALDGQITQAWVTANTRSKDWVPLWSDITGLVDQLDDKAGAMHAHTWDSIQSKPTFASVATSGRYEDLANLPSIPSIPSVMEQAEGNLGTATTQRTINAANLKSIILNHSPAGSRPASDVHGWAKETNRPSYDLSQIAETTTYKKVTQTEKDGWNLKQDQGQVESLLESYDTLMVTPQLANKVPTSRLIAGINLVDNITVAELTAALNGATTSLKGLMSATDKSRLNTLYALLNDNTDGSVDTVVDNIEEVLAIFNNYPEGASIVTALANKLETSEVTEAATASKVAKRNSSGDLLARLFRSEYSSLSTTPNYIMVQHAVGAGEDNYIRPLSLSQLKTSLGSMPASDVKAWAKADNRPSYSYSDITGLVDQLDDKAGAMHTHNYSDIGGLQTQLNGKAASSHTHYISEVTGLQDALDGKAASTHNHTIAQVTGLQTTLNGKLGNSGIQQITGGHGSTVLKLFHDDIPSRRSTLGLWTSEPSVTYHGAGIGYNITTMPHGTSNAGGIIDTDYAASWIRFDRSEVTAGQRLTDGTIRTNTLLSSSGQLLELGERVYSPNNKPSWSDVQSKPSWIGSSKPTYDLDNISDGTTYKRVTQADKNTWNNKENAANKRTSIRTSGAENTSYVSELGVKTYVDDVASNIQTQLNNKWKQIYAGTSAALSEFGSTNITVPSAVYSGKTVAIEIRYGSNSVNAFTNRIVFVTLGVDGGTGTSKTEPKYISFSEWDGRYLKHISTKCYVTTAAATTNIVFGNLKTLIGSFSGTTIEWTTQVLDNLSVYIGKIWVLD